MLNPTDSPFAKMYGSFGLFERMRRKHGRQFVAMSAGVNWAQACPIVVDSLKWELDYAVSTRNYGRSCGSHAVTTILELVENAEAGSQGIRIALFNGATEAASMIIEGLLLARILVPGDRAMMVGHAFPLYHAFAERFGLEFCECLGLADTSETLLPGPDAILSMVERERPRIVFVLLPNNPVGEQVSPETLRRLVAKLRESGATLLVDRVCQMPWDKSEPAMAALAPGILDGFVFVVDSFSKSESLAGLRTGYAALNEDWRKRIEIMTQTRALNPIVFSTATLAFTRLAEADPQLLRSAQRLIRPQLEAIFSEYPRHEERPALIEHFNAFRDAYEPQVRAKAKAIQANFCKLQEGLEKYSDHRFLWEAGFNVAVRLRSMRHRHEARDQHTLAEKLGVGVLPESCFRFSPNVSESYFIRVGLSLPEEDFAEGVTRLAEYYHGLDP